MTQIINDLQHLQSVLGEHLQTCSVVSEPLIKAVESLPDIIAMMRHWDGRTETGVRQLRIHRDWCEKHAESEREMGRFLGADVMWATFNSEILPFIRPPRAA